MGRKKKSKNVFVMIGKAIGWLIVNFFKAIYYIFVGIFKGVKSTTKTVKKVHKAAKEKAAQPKTSANYSAPSVKSTVTGSFKEFEQRLSNESLIIAVAGRRGSGKSVLGFRLLENIHNKTNRPCFALGVKQSVMPSWIDSIEDINDVSNNGVVLVDEGAISFGSRDSMSKKNKGLSHLLAIARHKDLTLLFITQNTGMIDKNVLNLCDTIILKEGSLLQEKMERSVMKDLYKTANKAISTMPSKDRKPFCYVFDSEFEGLIKVSLPSFWSTRVSKSRA